MLDAYTPFDNIPKCSCELESGLDRKADSGGLGRHDCQRHNEQLDYQNYIWKQQEATGPVPFSIQQPWSRVLPVQAGPTVSQAPGDGSPL